MGARPIMILGAGGQGTVVLDLCRDIGAEVAGFLDNHAAPGTVVNGAAVQGRFEAIEDAELRARCRFFVALGDPGLRRRWGQAVLDRGGQLATLVHPWAKVSPYARLGRGCMVNAFSFVYANARLDDLVTIDSNSTVGIDNQLGVAVFVAPGSCINAHVSIGAEAYVGSGVTVVPRVAIGARAMIGAGATVTADVPAGKLAVGCPARVIRDVARAA